MCGRWSSSRTEVDPALPGQGVGGALVEGALDHVRGLGLRDLPRHSEYAELDDRQPAGVVD